MATKGSGRTRFRDCLVLAWRRPATRPRSASPSANTIADLAGSGGSARAAGIVGGANALAGSFQNAGNNYMQMSMFDRIMGRGVGSGAVPNGSAGNNWSYV